MISVLNYILQNVTTETEKRGVNLFIKSPFTSEKTASFCIFQKTDSFFDYSSDFGGDVVELHRKLNSLSRREAYRQMIQGEFQGTVSLINLLPPNPHKVAKSTFKVLEIIDIEDQDLINYFYLGRGINPHILKEHCKEIHYEVKGFNNKGICFINNIGGYEIRSAKFKGGFGSKDVKFIQGAGDPDLRKKYLNIFEGFSDFLAYLTLSNKLNDYYNTYVLNSVVFKDRIKLPDGTQKLRCFVDNDDAGNKAIEYYKVLYGEEMVQDMRGYYKDFNDVNEYLIAKNKI